MSANPIFQIDYIKKSKENQNLKDLVFQFFYNLNLAEINTFLSKYNLFIQKSSIQIENEYMLYFLSNFFYKSLKKDFTKKRKDCRIYRLRTAISQNDFQKAAEVIASASRTFAHENFGLKQELSEFGRLKNENNFYELEEEKEEEKVKIRIKVNKKNKKSGQLFVEFAS